VVPIEVDRAQQPQSIGAFVVCSHGALTDATMCAVRRRIRLCQRETSVRQQRFRDSRAELTCVNTTGARAW